MGISIADEPEPLTSKLPVSVVVVNYNAGTDLVGCVRFVLPQVSEVIVVDNASSDLSIEECLREFVHNQGVMIVENKSNVGFACACNQGFAFSQSEYVLFLNPDCCLQEGVVPKLLLAFQGCPKVGMVGGLLVNPDGTEQAGGRRSVPTPWRSFVRALGLNKLAPRWPRLFEDFVLHLQPLPEFPIEVEAISGACMMVKRESVDDVGLWDEGYFLHCEDLDWCMRFRQKGWTIMFVPDAPVIHHKGGCSQKQPIFVEWHKHKGMIRFYRKFFRQQYPGIIMWLVTVGVWSRFVVLSGMHLLKRIRS